MPDGKTCLFKLIENSNLTGVTKLIEFIKHTRKNGQTGVSFSNIPDINGETPLHLCVKNHYTMASEELLDLLGENIPLDHHSSYTQDLLPFLIKTCPIATANYIQTRVKDISWGKKQTIGSLKLADPNVSFGVTSYPLIYIDEKDINQKLFDREGYVQQRLRDNAEQKRLPMKLRVFDFPKLHHFGNQTGKELMMALSESSDIQIYDTEYIQALLEYQWPQVKKAIITDLLMPYIFFVICFNFYALI